MLPAVTLWALVQGIRSQASDGRERLIAYVRTLDGDRRALTGRHAKYGDVSVDRYLEIALEHDRNHLRGLERLAGQRTR